MIQQSISFLYRSTEFLRDAISSVDVKNKEQSGFVIQEIERGYMLYDRVIRHAKVIVGK